MSNSSFKIVEKGKYSIRMHTACQYWGGGSAGYSGRSATSNPPLLEGLSPIAQPMGSRGRGHPWSTLLRDVFIRGQGGFCFLMGVCLLRGICLPMVLWGGRLPYEQTDMCEINTLPHTLYVGSKNNFVQLSAFNRQIRSLF